MDGKMYVISDNKQFQEPNIEYKVKWMAKTDF